MTLQALRHEVPGAGSPLTRWILAGPSRQALVLANFPTALYLAVGEHHEVMPVLTSDALLLPTAVRLPKRSGEIAWGVEPGDSVSVGQSGIRLPGWQIRIVREWRPARVCPAPQVASSVLLSEVADSLSGHVHSAELIDQAMAVCRAARSGDDAEVRRGTRQLVGAGQGLTPSGDDVLCAVLLVLSGTGEPGPTALLGKAIAELWSRTTSLSASLLDAACKGYAVAEVVTLVERALRGDLAGCQRALAPALAIGHSSGQDLVAGIAGSLRALTLVRSMSSHGST